MSIFGRKVAALLLVVTGACGTAVPPDALVDAASPDASIDAPRGPYRYEGFIAIGERGASIAITVANSGCACWNPPISPGECGIYTDVANGCGDGCVPCIDAITLSDGSAEVVVQWDELRGFHQRPSHPFTPSSSISITIRGCAGSVDAVAQVPVEVPVTVEPPEQLSSSSIRVRWAPSGLDEAEIGAGNGGESQVCRQPDTGQFDLDVPPNISSVFVCRRELVQAIETEAASISIFQEHMGWWSNE